MPHAFSHDMEIEVSNNALTHLLHSADVAQSLR